MKKVVIISDASDKDIFLMGFLPAIFLLAGNLVGLGYWIVVDFNLGLILFSAINIVFSTVLSLRMFLNLTKRVSGHTIFSDDEIFSAF
jgi:uncharacterized membrane protein